MTTDNQTNTDMPAFVPAPDPELDSAVNDVRNAIDALEAQLVAAGWDHDDANIQSLGLRVALMDVEDMVRDNQ